MVVKSVGLQRVGRSKIHPRVQMQAVPKSLYTLPCSCLPVGLPVLEVLIPLFRGLEPDLKKNQNKTGRFSFVVDTCHPCTVPLALISRNPAELSVSDGKP